MARRISPTIRIDCESSITKKRYPQRIPGIHLHSETPELQSVAILDKHLESGTLCTDDGGGKTAADRPQKNVHSAPQQSATFLLSTVIAGCLRRNSTATSARTRGSPEKPRNRSFFEIAYIFCFLALVPDGLARRQAGLEAGSLLGCTREIRGETAGSVGMLYPRAQLAVQPPTKTARRACSASEWARDARAADVSAPWRT